MAPPLKNRAGEGSDFVQLAGDEEEAAAALRCLPADDYDDWIRIGFALKQAFGPSGFQLWNNWSSGSHKYPGEAELREVWDGLEPDGTLTIGTLFWMAQQNGWNGPSNPHIRWMNARYAIYTHGRSTMIIEKERDPDDVEAVRMIGKDVLKDRLASNRIPMEVDNGDTKKVPIVQQWLPHPLAEHVHRLEFEPDRPPGTCGKVFNTWTGFGVEPAKGDWSLLEQHIREVIADRDHRLAEWLLNWMALGVQRPGLVIGTAPVLKGLPGVGKGILANAYGRLWGRHFQTVTHATHVQGNFSGHLSGKRFVFVDEGIFGGDRSAAGILKTRLTEPYTLIEKKGLDAERIRNHMIFMVASNEDSVVPADLGDRRWQIFPVGDRHREDRVYFGAIAAQMEHGGHAAMLHDLLKRDVGAGPDPQVTIKSEGLFDQVLRAAGPELKYVYEFLDTGELPQPWAPLNGPGISTIQALYEDMCARDSRGRFIPQSVYGKKLAGMFPNMKRVPSGWFMERGPDGNLRRRRSTRYEFPDLRTCRRQFETFVGLPVPWTHPDLDWQEAPPDVRWDDDHF